MPKWTGVGGSEKILGSKPKQRTVGQQLKNTESGRNSLLRGRVNQLVIQYQTLNVESIHTSYIIQTEQIIFRNIMCIQIKIYI